MLCIADRLCRLAYVSAMNWRGCIAPFVIIEKYSGGDDACSCIALVLRRDLVCGGLRFSKIPVSLLNWMCSLLKAPLHCVPFAWSNAKGHDGHAGKDQSCYIPYRLGGSVDSTQWANPWPNIVALK